MEFLTFCNQNALTFKSQRTEEVELCSLGTCNFPILGNETDLIIADYKKLICKNLQVCYVEYKVIAKRGQNFVSILSFQLNEVE